MEDTHIMSPYTLMNVNVPKYTNTQSTDCGCRGGLTNYSCSNQKKKANLICFIFESRNIELIGENELMECERGDWRTDSMNCLLFK